nr:MAG TPA: hypothetical protein [Caudoviricetes sp.]
MKLCSSWYLILILFHNNQFSRWFIISLKLIYQLDITVLIPLLRIFQYNQRRLVKQL